MLTLFGTFQVASWIAAGALWMCGRLTAHEPDPEAAETENSRSMPLAPPPAAVANLGEMEELQLWDVMFCVPMAVSA